MTGIVVGINLGLQGNSSQTLGSQGLIGNPSLGRSGENVYVNAQTGNLVIQSQDEYLTGVGPDVSILDTYNSLGTLTADNFMPSVDQSVALLSGTVNTAGSTVRQVAADGSLLTYSYTTKGLYVLTDGAGSEATLKFSSSTNLWTWTAGNGASTQSYDSTHSGRITASSDLNGNSVVYGYNATSGLLTSVTTSDGETTYLDYTGTLLTDLRTVYLQGGASTTLTRTYYAYDSSNRYSPTALDGASTENIYWSHWTGYQGEINLANEVAGSGQTVLKWGDSIGTQGSDIISVDPNSGDVTLWDSKYRSASSTIQQSPTFANPGPSENAVSEAIDAVKNSNLPPETMQTALHNLLDGNYTTNTVGSGGARNSVQVSYVSGKPTVGP